MGWLDPEAPTSLRAAEFRPAIGTATALAVRQQRLRDRLGPRVRHGHARGILVAMEEVEPVSEIEDLRTAVIEAAWDACEWGDWHEINHVLPRILRAAGVEGPFEQYQ